MSEILTIDTETGIKKESQINPLPLYGDDFHMLSDEIPKYIDALPNTYMSDLIKKLKMTMKLYGGIGLSANQCGVYERVFVIGTDDYQMACINPEIVDVSDELVKEPEGCLSFPGLNLKIKRPKSIKAKFLNENGQPQEIWLDGLTARCYLHELDHMNGVKFTERVGSVSLIQAKRKQQKIIKKVSRKK